MVADFSEMGAASNLQRMGAVARYKGTGEVARPCFPVFRLPRPLVAQGIEGPHPRSVSRVGGHKDVE